MDTGLLIIRIVVGLLFAGHGVQKLSHRLGGHGLEGTTAFTAQLGFRPAKPMALLSGLTELGAGLLLATGLLTPLAGAGFLGQMVVAGWVAHRQNGPWVTGGGWEYNAVLAAIGVGLAFTGPGAASLDNAAGLDLDGTGWGILAIALGLAAAVLTLVTRAPTGEAADDAEPTSARDD